MKRAELVAALLLAALPVSWGCRGQEPSAAAAAVAPPVESEDGAREPAPHGRTCRVIWLGLDGLDWDHLDALAATGLLPNWSRLAQEGFDAKLSAFEPILSPLLWTTQQTGVGPDVHGVLDFQEVDQATGRPVPVSQASRKFPAVWDFASHLGRKVGVVGFWATHPAEKVNGFFLSDRITAGRSIPAGTAYPERLSEAIAQVATREATVPVADLAPYLDAPEAEVRAALSGSTGPKDLIFQLARIVGETRVTQRLARKLYDRERPDLLAAYFEGTDQIGHLFARYAPPKLGCTDEASFHRFQRVPEAYFRMVDLILGQWMRRAREDGAVLVVTSDHGFRWGQGRACGTAAAEIATAALSHRREGVFLAWGEGVPPRPRGLVASTFDVAPTLLALLGLPVDQAMRGAVLPVLPKLRAHERRDLASSLRVSTVAAAPPDRREATEYAKKLVALGYISAGEAARQELTPAPAGLTKSAWNNLGIYLRFTAKDPAGARRAWEQALRIDPSYHSPSYNIARLEKDAGRLDEATRWLLRAIAAGHPEPEATVESWAAEFGQQRHGAALALLQALRKAYPASEAYTRHYALLLVLRRRCREAEEALAPLEESRQAATLNTAAAAAVCLGRLDRVRTLLRRSLATDPNQPKVRVALATLERQQSHP